MKLLEGKLTLSEEQVRLRRLDVERPSRRPIKEGVYDDCTREIDKCQKELNRLKSLLARVRTKEAADLIYDKIATLEQQIGDCLAQQAEIRYIDNGSIDNYDGFESLKEDKDNKGNSISDDEIMEILCLSDDLLGDTEEEQQKNKKEYCRLFRGLLKKGYNKNDIYDCCDSLLNEFDEDEIIDQSPGGDLVVAIHKEDYEESLKEAKEDDKKSDKKDDKKSSKKDTKKKDKKEDEEDIDIEDEVDIDIEDDKDLPDVDVDDMLSLDDIDIDVDTPIATEEPPVDIEITADEVPEDIITNAKTTSISDVVRNEFDSIDALKGVIATLTLTDGEISEDDENVIDILNEIVDLKLEVVGMLNKALEITDGDLVDSMLDGADKAEEIIADTDDEITVEDNIEDVFGGGQELEVSDKFDIERDDKEKGGMFDLDDVDKLPDEEEDSEIIIKDRKTK